MKAMLESKSAVIEDEAQNLKLRDELLEAGAGSDRTLRQRVGYGFDGRAIDRENMNSSVSAYDSERVLPQRRKKRIAQNQTVMMRLSVQQLSLQVWNERPFAAQTRPPHTFLPVSARQDWEVAEDVKVLTSQGRTRKAVGGRNSSPRKYGTDRWGRDGADDGDAGDSS